ncbi:MAG: glycosyltransferase family 2 protein [Candidatus Nomurabacteria bacterium]|nr:glycosyltransferase family 2 protein [Candidatus Nomurabacteria bacterium]
MKNPKISIITPCYNSRKYIEKCINSVVSQTYKNIESIIVDGASNDGTLDILEKYKDKIIYISEKDNGNYDAIKKGFKMATGDIITWIDSDNYYYQNDIIEKIAEVFINKEVEIVITNSYSHYEGSKKMTLVNPSEQKINSSDLINQGNMFMPECSFYKKNLYDRSGGLNLEYKFLADYELWIKIFNLNPKLIKLPIVSSVYEVRGDALLRKNFFRVWQEGFVIGKIYNRDFISKIAVYILYIKAIIRYLLTSIISKNKRLRKFILKRFY